MRTRTRLAVAVTLSLFAAETFGASPELAQKLHDQAAPSLVGVQFTWENELGRRELIGAGVVVREDGLVMAPLAIFDQRIPDDQMKEFKLVVAHEDRDSEEIDATFLGRDERSNVAFLLPAGEGAAVATVAAGAAGSGGGGGASAGKRAWKPIKFEEVVVRLGEPVYSVGMLPEMANYKPYFMEAAVAAQLRGEVPQVLVNGGLAAVGSPVFNAAGKAIGVAAWQPGQTVFLNDQQGALSAVTTPPKFYVPSRDFAQSLSDPPKAGEPMRLPWLGVTQMQGVNKDVAEVFGLTNQPAVQIGDVIEGGPADKAGLREGQIVVKRNGKPLERGDEPDELPQILSREVRRMKVGDTVTLSVMTGRDQPLKEFKVTLEEMPKRQNMARRWYADDLGFSVREMVFMDTYARKLAPDAKGVVVSLIRPQSAAHTGHLRSNDLITELNREPVTDLDQFRKAYEAFRREKPREAVVMIVLRESNTEVIRIEPPQ
jgi:S1-C subfamily serine protease